MVIISRISQEGEDASLDLTGVPTWLTYIKGWGSLKDKWNKRYGSAYNPAYTYSYNGSTLKMEDRLWRETFRGTTYTANPKGYPTPNSNFEYNTSDGGIAWVQEWMRVSPGIDFIEVRNDDFYDFPWWYTGVLLFHWPDSYEEKYSNIVSTFERAKEIQDILYINSLCGYYITTSLKTSYTPYTGEFTIKGNSYKGGDLGSGCLGGEFYTYNVARNTRVYDCAF